MLLLPFLVGSFASPRFAFFPAWLRYGYCFFFGVSWLHWWLQFIDDGLAHAPDETRCELRYHLMVVSQEYMGLHTSPKMTKQVPALEVEHVGLTWTINRGRCRIQIGFVQKPDVWQESQMQTLTR
eukprot:TRINITY_DN3179_c0_g2_i13.p1 TRINITY_DN3179_c0_g2~~TRINITY_DN3179_c0_g2_i13.p1  ORF type:complete len:125 (+),score=1.39 TRINITY_DN3179_c0_g2_i13:383-757(+)